MLVIDCHKDARAASAGGIITDGGFRDRAKIAAMNFPAFHQRPSAATNLTLHHAIDINVPIGYENAPVFPGDIVVTNAEGFIIIPAELADEIAAETTAITLFEDFVLEQVRAGHSICGLYPATDPATHLAFENWKANRA